MANVEQWVPIGDRLERRIDQTWRHRIQVAEEDRRRIMRTPWDGRSYRYFKSANVVAFEHYRRMISIAELTPTAA